MAFFCMEYDELCMKDLKGSAKEHEARALGEHACAAAQVQSPAAAGKDSFLAGKPGTAVMLAALHAQEEESEEEEDESRARWARMRGLAGPPASSSGEEEEDDEEASASEEGSDGAGAASDEVRPVVRVCSAADPVHGL